MTCTQLLAARAAYRDELTQLAFSDPRIVCLEADLGGGRHPFREAHPKRFYNLGIAEATMIDVAVGMAAAGLRPFVSTFATFAALRAAESIKLGLGYARASVTIVAPYAGYSGAWLGGTHHCLEDSAVIRALPGVRLAAPAGDAEMRAVIRRSLTTGEPHYIRTGRNAVFGSESWQAGEHAVDGEWLRIDGSQCLVSFGEEATRVCQEVIARKPGISHLHLCYGDDAALTGYRQDLQRYSRIVVVEEHRSAGGVASALALGLPSIPVISFDVGAEWLSTGGQHSDLLASAGFTAARLEKVLTSGPES